MNKMTKDGAPLKDGIIYSDGARDSARLTWPIKQALDEARRGEMTDAEQRNQWCEQMKARVYWLPDGKWWVDWSDQWLRTVSDPDRNTAIDRARGVK